MNHPSPRIERWVIKLMPYNFTLEYQPGSQNSADYLSRSNPVSSVNKQSNVGDEYIRMIAKNSLPNAISITTLQDATFKDKQLQSLIPVIKSGKFSNIGPLKEYYNIRHFLSYHNGLILYRRRIVIPKSLRSQIFKLAHEGHQGIVRTKQRLRRKVYWPGMNIFVENHIKSCHSCQVVSNDQPPTPIVSTPIPKGSWLLLGCDLVGPFPTGEHLLVCIDYYSRYPEVDILHTITSDAISSKIRKCFCRYGAPEEIVTDNGPQFQAGTSFAALMKEFSVKHRKVTPYHPIANGEVERFNRNLKKCIQTAIAAGEDWRVALNNFLLSYRTTPHAVTGVPPADLLFGRNIRDKLPALPNEAASSNGMRARDDKFKLLSRKYTDTKRRAKSHTFTKGDKVLLRNMKKHRNKFTSRWLPIPDTVADVKGNAIFLENNGMRSSQHVRHYYAPDDEANIQAQADIISDNEPGDEAEFSVEEEEEGYDSEDTIPYEEDEEHDNFDNENVRRRRAPLRYRDYDLS